MAKGKSGPTGAARSLAKIDLFAALSVAQREGIEARCRWREYPKGASIIDRESPETDVYFVVAGSVRVVIHSESGREVAFDEMGPGGCVGELAAIDGGPRSASVMTLEPCVCSIVSRTGLREHLAEEPEFALDLVAQVIRRARAATETARNMALLDVYGRVIATLESHKGPAKPDEPVILTQITHQNIASRVGASREMVSRLLKDLEKGGYIELGVKRITLLKKLPSRW